jgi:uncharacterized protein (TIGR03435 family)
MCYKHNMPVVALLLAALAGAGAYAGPQTSSAAPSFEVASIKPSASDAAIGMYGESGRFFASNVTLRMLVAFAYDRREFEVGGGPNWAAGERFSIEATFPPGVPPPQTIEGRQQMRRMLQALLTDRFGLMVSETTREGPAYELAIAKGGARLKQADPAGKGNSLRAGRGQLEGTGATMTALVQLLSQQLGRSVTDGTGLTGRYDFSLRYDADTGQPGSPAIFTAVQEQLGLELRSVRRPLPVITIEQARRPDPN